MAKVGKEFVIDQLRRVGADRGLKLQKDRAWIRCCWHKGGRENTPSLSISLVDHPKYGAGSWKCFGCGMEKTLKDEGKGGGSWKNLATKLGLSTGDTTKEAAPTIQKSEIDYFDELLFSKKSDKQSELEQFRKVLKKCPKHLKSREWRGMPGKLVHNLGGLDAKNPYGQSRLYFPVMVNGEWCSGIFCAYIKNDKTPSYIYDGDPRINRSLFPYDYIVSKLKKLSKKNRYLVIVEGPRDAMHLIANGIPALAVLGGVTSWNKEKAKLILDLGICKVVVAPDPDEVGDALYAAIRKDLKPYMITTKRFAMDYKVETVLRQKKKVTIKKKLEDPGSLTPDRIADLKRCILRYIRQ